MFIVFEFNPVLARRKRKRLSEGSPLIGGKLGLRNLDVARERVPFVPVSGDIDHSCDSLDSAMWRIIL